MNSLPTWSFFKDKLYNTVMGLMTEYQLIIIPIDYFIVLIASELYINILIIIKRIYFTYLLYSFSLVPFLSIVGHIHQT